MPIRRSILVVSLLLSTTALCSSRAYAQQVQVTRVVSSVDGEQEKLTQKESIRIERFLTRVFPTKPLRRFAHVADRPTTRRITYTVINQDGTDYILAGFTARWRDAFNILGIYKIEKEGPNQIWRSNPWEATYYGLAFSTAKLGKRSLILFREGANDDFGLASVFSFQEVSHGVAIRDLTPSLPRLRAFTRFPFHPLYGQSINLALTSDPKADILLSASDGNYQLLGTEPIRPTTTWRLNRSRVRFERVGQKEPSTMTQLGRE